VIDVISLGEILIDMVSTQKNVTLYDAPAFEPKPGGAPANVAVGVQRLGRSAAFVGKVGADEFGQGLRRLLQAEGVDTRNLVDDPHNLTTLAMVSLSDRGDPHFVFYTGAGLNLRPDDLDVALIESARILHIGSVMLSGEPARSATLEALRFAKASHVICSYDINWRPALWHDVQSALDVIKRPLPQVDILKMNAGELRLITGEPDERLALEKLDAPALLVAVTLGDQGCLYRFRGKVYRQSVQPVRTVVDATGAGDAFMAALLAGLPLAPDSLEEPSLARLMARACQAGAITTTRRGAIPALPSLADLKDFEL
jgi:fructokinase